MGRTAAPTASIGQTAATCELETRGREQIKELLTALRAADFEHVERVEPSGRQGALGRLPTY